MDEVQQREVKLEAECGRLRAFVADGEQRYKKEVEWFHGQIEELKRLADRRIEEKDKEIASLTQKIHILSGEVEKQYAQSLNKVHDMDAVWKLQEELLRKRTEIEAEAIARETRFSHDKQEWIKQIEEIKQHTHEVLARFEHEYCEKRKILEEEYKARQDALSRREELLREHEQQLNEKEESFAVNQQAADKRIQEMNLETARLKNIPQFDPAPGQVMPLVEECLHEQALSRLIAVLLQSLNDGIEAFIEKMPEKYRKDMAQVHDVIMKQGNEITAAVEPFTLEFQMTSIQLVIEEVLKRLEGFFAERKIDIKKSYDETIPHLVLDPRRLLEVFNVFFYNACDAMRDGGTVQVSIMYDRQERKVKVVVEDSGVGIDRKNIPQVGKPFYTTKKGRMGLNVYRAQLILQRMKAEMMIERSAKNGLRVTCVFSVPEQQKVLLP